MVPPKKNLLLERYVLNNDLDMIYRFGVDVQKKKIANM